MYQILLGLIVCLVIGSPCMAANVSRSYSYFSVHGHTLSAIEEQLERRGPEVTTTGKRHPGATRMTFSTRITYGRQPDRCWIADARVSVKAKVILPRWRDRKGSEIPVQLIWDTLERDIKRHEESHISIATNHARALESALRALPASRDCNALARQAQETATRLLAAHDAAQARFDRIENINFESRILRLLRYRLEGNRPAQVPAHQ